MTRTRTAGPSAGGGMTGPQLPAFYMPIGETGVSAWLPAAERELWPWLSARGLAPGEHVRGHIRRTNPALLSARFYPAAGCGILPLLAQFCAWAFIVDDEFDEGACGRDSALSGRAVAGLLAVLEHGAAAGASPPMAALADLWGRLTAGRSAGWCRQFADNIRSWLITYHQGALQHESGYAPGIEEFCGYRQLAVGMHMFLDLAEVVAEHVAFLNDIFSAHKDDRHDSLAICGHDRHRRQRRLVQPAFQATRLPAYAAVITERAGRLTDSWRYGATIDVPAEMRAFTSQVAVATMFAASMSQAEQKQALDDMSTLLSGTYKRMFMPALLSRLPMPGNRRYKTVRARLRFTLGRLMETYRATGTDHGDVLSKLLSYQEDGTPRLTDEEVVDQILILFTGGSETTANVLSWAVHLVARHPDVETRLHAEADAVLAGRAATLEDLGRLPYTRQVVTETLRLYPPVSMVTRVVTADTELGGHRLRAGCVVVFSPAAVHQHPGLFPEPGRFTPDRWAVHPQPAQPALPRGAFVPFGDGPRKCIGDTIGMTMATLALASIAARWRLEIPAEARVRPVLRTFLAPRGLRATVRAR